MNIVLIIVLLCGIAYFAFFHRPKQDSVSEVREWLSAQLIKISENLANDIEQDKRGHYPHPGRQSFEPRGSITYTLVDKNMSRYELSQFSELTTRDIETTPGYASLKDTVDRMGLKLSLDEIEVEGDGVSSWNELDEFVYDIPRYYTITISGWSV